MLSNILHEKCTVWIDPKWFEHRILIITYKLHITIIFHICDGFDSSRQSSILKLAKKVSKFAHVYVQRGAN